MSNVYQLAAIPVGVKHWHGAAKDSWFAYIAIEVPGENTSNEWLEPVLEEEYVKYNPDFRPAIAGELPDIEEYNAVFVGFPIWLAYHNLIQCTQVWVQILTIGILGVYQENSCRHKETSQQRN